ncbi:hypothetical protein VXQ18_04285 [Brucella abortus]|nr:hypothetical protein [Brucella abortus]
MAIPSSTSRRQHIQHGKMQRLQGIMAKIKRGKRLEILLDKPG